MHPALNGCLYTPGSWFFHGSVITARGIVFYRFAQRQLIIDLTRDINDLKKCLKDVKATKEIQVIQWSQQEDINRLEKE